MAQRASPGFRSVSGRRGASIFLAAGVVGWALQPRCQLPDSTCLASKPWDGGVVANASYADRVGSAEVLLYRSGRFHVKLAGWGTGPLVERCLGDVENMFKKIPSVGIYVYLDMLDGRGSSPRAVSAALKFMERNGHRVARVAVVGPPPIVAFMRIVAAICKQEGVDFFGRPAAAEAWLSQQLAHGRATWR